MNISAKNCPGLYAVDVAGTLPEEILQLCDQYGCAPRQQRG